MLVSHNFIRIVVWNFLLISENTWIENQLDAYSLNLSDRICNTWKDDSTCSDFVNRLSWFVILNFLQKLHKLVIRFLFFLRSFWKNVLIFWYFLLAALFCFFFLSSQSLVDFILLFNFKDSFINLKIDSV